MDSPTIQLALDWLVADDVVLDVGCAAGKISCALAPSVRQITGIDISPKMIALAREKAHSLAIENVTFSLNSLFDEAFTGEQFDKVLAYNVLHLVDDVPATLDRMYELLKPGGVLLVMVACMRDQKFLNLGEWVLFRPLIALGMIPKMHFFSKDQLRRELERSGFQIEENKATDDASGIMVVARRP